MFREMPLVTDKEALNRIYENIKKEEEKRIERLKNNLFSR